MLVGELEPLREVLHRHRWGGGGEAHRAAGSLLLERRRTRRINASNGPATCSHSRAIVTARALRPRLARGRPLHRRRHRADRRPPRRTLLARDRGGHAGHQRRPPGGARAAARRGRPAAARRSACGWSSCPSPRPRRPPAYFSLHARAAARACTRRCAPPTRDRGPDLIEFCDYLAEGFVTVQARHTLDPWLARTLVCVRLHTTAEMCRVLDGHVRRRLRDGRDPRRRALRPAPRRPPAVVAAATCCGTYQRFYGAGALAPGERIPDAFLARAGRARARRRPGRATTLRAALPRPRRAAQGRAEPAARDDVVGRDDVRADAARRRHATRAAADARCAPSSS